MAIRFIEDDLQIGVTKLPDRKGKCLYKMEGNLLTPLAYFRNDEAAEDFEKYFNKMIDFILTGKH